MEDSTIRPVPLSTVNGWHWEKFPRSLLTDHAKAIGPAGIALYMALLFTAKGNPTTITSYATLSQLSGMGRTATISAMQRLAARKLVKVCRRHFDHEQLMNEYHLLA